MGTAEIQGTLWGAAAQDWATYQEASALPLWKDVLRGVGAGNGIKLLDAGCGAGGASVEAAKLGCELTGVDASSQMLTIAHQRLPQGKFEKADIESLSFDDSVFDAVIAVNSIMYAADMAQAMNELARVLCPGGYLAITSWGKPEQCEMKDIFGAVVSTLPEKPPGGGPFALSIPGMLESLLTNTGLNVIARGESRCDFIYPDFDICWRAIASAGPLQAAMNAVGLETVRAAVKNVVNNYTEESGTITMRNVFWWAVGKRA